MIISEDGGASQFTNIPKHRYHDDDVMMLMMMMVIVMEIMMRTPEEYDVGDDLHHIFNHHLSISFKRPHIHLFSLQCAL